MNSMRVNKEMFCYDVMYCKKSFLSNKSLVWVGSSPVSPEVIYIAILDSTYSFFSEQQE